MARWLCFVLYKAQQRRQHTRTLHIIGKIKRRKNANKHYFKIFLCQWITIENNVTGNKRGKWKIIVNFLKLWKTCDIECRSIRCSEHVFAASEKKNISLKVIAFVAKISFLSNICIFNWLLKPAVDCIENSESCRRKSGEKTGRSCGCFQSSVCFGLQLFIWYENYLIWLLHWNFDKTNELEIAISQNYLILFSIYRLLIDGKYRTVTAPLVSYFSHKYSVKHGPIISTLLSWFMNEKENPGHWYGSYHSKIRRCTLIVAHIRKKRISAVFLPWSASNSPIS